MDLSKVEDRRAMMEPLMEAVNATAAAHDAARSAFDVAAAKFKRQFEPERAALLVGVTEAAKAVVDTEIAAKAAMSLYQEGLAKLPKAGEA